MDMFMDKLTQKLTAQEIIRANTAADTAELNRLKNQVAEYNECLERLKKLINEGENKVNRDAGEPDGLQAQIAELLGNMDKAMVDQLCNMDKAIADQLDGAETKVTEQLSGMEKTVSDRLTGVEKTVTDRMDGVEKTVSGRLTGVETKVTERLGGTEKAVSDRLAGVETKVTERLGGTEKAVSDRLAGLETKVSGRLDSVEQSVSEQLKAMTQTLDEKLAGVEMQTAGQLDERLTERLDAIDENTHREGVKIYRNVQAVVLEESGKQSEAAKETAISVDRVRGKLNLLFGISIAALFFSLAGVVIQILSLLNIITV